MNYLQEIVCEIGANDLGLEAACSEVDRLRAENAKLREQLTAAQAEARKLRHALKTLHDWRQPQPHKLDEALAWRQNDDLVEKIVQEALAPANGGLEDKTARTEQSAENAKLREDKERLDWLLATGNICVVRQIKGCDTTWDKPTTRERIDWHINHPDESARKAALRLATEPHGEETKNL